MVIATIPSEATRRARAVRDGLIDPGAIQFTMAGVAGCFCPNVSSWRRETLGLQSSAVAAA